MPSANAGSGRSGDEGRRGSAAAGGQEQSIYGWRRQEQIDTGAGGEIVVADGPESASTQVADGSLSVTASPVTGENAATAAPRTG